MLILINIFSYLCSIEPAAFIVTAQVVSQTSAQEQINVTWTVSCTVMYIKWLLSCTVYVRYTYGTHVHAT